MILQVYSSLRRLSQKTQQVVGYLHYVGFDRHRRSILLQRAIASYFFGNESFPRWKKYCQELGLPYTGNTLPDVEEMVIKMSVGPSQVDYYEDTVTQQFDSALDFFRHLKKLGASTQKEGRSLSAREFSMLVDHWDAQAKGSVNIDYHVIFLAVKKDY